MITRKPLFLLKQGDKFVQNGKTYTVYQHQDNMSEVFTDNRFWAFPNWNGKSVVMVDQVQY